MFRSLAAKNAYLQGEHMKMDILSVLEHKFPSFSKGQRTIAQFILKNYDKAAFMTAARLGEVTGVSESTVVRFAADLGYRGYPGMKKALQEIVRNRLTSVERIEAAESTMDGHDVLKAVLRADINNLQATLDEVDQDNFDQAVDMILSAKHIYIIGMRTSTTLADFLGIYLKLLLDDVTVVKEIAAAARCTSDAAHRRGRSHHRHQLPALFQAHEQRHEVRARSRCTLPRHDGQQGLAAQRDLRCVPVCKE